MGPILPLLSNLEAQHQTPVTAAVRALRAFEQGLAVEVGGATASG
jgi:hypothetical protein